MKKIIIKWLKNYIENWKIENDIICPRCKINLIEDSPDFFAGLKCPKCDYKIGFNQFR